MLAVVNERHITEEQAAQLELEELAPEKFDVELQFKVNSHVSDRRKEPRYTTYSPEEVRRLLEASRSSPTPVQVIEQREYPTLSREECERLVREHFEYKDNKGDA